VTRKKAKDIALGILARWNLRTVGKQSLLKAAVAGIAPEAEVSQGRRALLRALSRPVRI